MMSANYSKKNIISNHNKLTFREKIFKPEGIKIIYTFILISLLLITYIIINYQYLFPKKTIISDLMVISGFALPLMIWNIYFSKSKIDLINLSLIVFFLFLGSHSVLDLLGMESNAFFLNTTINGFDIFKASLIVIIGINFFVLGAVYANNNKYPDGNKIINHDFFSNATIINHVGIIMLIIGGAAFIIGFDSSFLNGSYKNFGSETALDLVWNAFLPVAGFTLILSNSKLYRNTGILLCLILSFYFILAGNRGYSISLFLTLVWLYSFKVQKIKFIKFIVISFIILFISTTFYQLKSSTVDEKLQISSYTKLEESPVIFTLKEGSTTFRSILYTSISIPETKSYALGESYFWAITTIIPNVFGQENHPSVSYINPSEWLGNKYDKYQMNIGNGFGFSIVSEAYYNFGFIGVVLIMFIVGYVINKYQIKAMNTRSLFYVVIISIIIHNFFWAIRNIAQSVVRAMVWEIIALLVSILIYEIIFHIKKVPK